MGGGQEAQHLVHLLAWLTPVGPEVDDGLGRGSGGGSGGGASAQAARAHGARAGAWVSCSNCTTLDASTSAMAQR